MKFVSRPQLVSSLRALADFRAAVDKQGAQHLIPFLALNKKGVGTGSPTVYTEKDDFAFFDEFMRVTTGDRPYFDPIASQFRIESHPHSNVATARKGTFSLSWKAATYTSDPKTKEERWKLSPDYLEIIKKRILTKAGRFTKVPCLPLASFLLRKHEFADTASDPDLADQFQRNFGLTKKQLQEIFEQTTTVGDFAAKQLTDDEILAAIQESGVVADTREAQSDFQEIQIKPDDPLLAEVRTLLFEDLYAGVVFTGPPGTSKSWYAVQVALALADGDASRVIKIQFHKSYQYEHFVQGFVPNEKGTGFELRDQLMLLTVKQAEENPGATHVVLIDELSRSDPARVFGELLTYIEPTRRGEMFRLASGRDVSIPRNIVFVATMNSRDKSVLEIDDAFERRIAKLEFPPRPDILEQFLTENGVAEALRRRILDFFRWIIPKYPLGHTFLQRVKDEKSLARAWETQIRHVLHKEFQYEPETLKEIRAKFAEITGVPAS